MTKDLTPEDFRNKLEEILESDASIQEKIRSGEYLVRVSRPYFKDSKLDVRQVLSDMTVKGGKTLPRNIVIQRIWRYEDRKIQRGIENQIAERMNRDE